MLPDWSKPNDLLVPSLSINEQIIKWQNDFVKVFLRQHIFVPYSEFDDTELISQRKINREVEGGIFGSICRIGRKLRNGGLLPWVKNWYCNESGRDLRKLKERKKYERTYGSMEPPRSLANRLERPKTCNPKMTMGGSPGRGLKVFLPDHVIRRGSSNIGQKDQASPQESTTASGFSELLALRYRYKTQSGSDYH